MVASPPAIVFDWVSLDGQREQLYAERADGGGVYRVSRAGRIWDEPRWTRDGNIAAFTERGLSIVTPQGRVVRRVTIRRSATRLRLSPDGARFAFVAEGCIDPRGTLDPGCGTLWIRRLDGREQRRMSPEGAVDVVSNFGNVYSWSPDGRRIAYASFDGLVVVDIATGRRRLVSRLTARTPDWSPDGRRLLYARGTSLVTCAPDGSDRRLVRGARDAFLAQWSPDGSRIAYIANASGRWPVVVSRPDGSGRRRLGNAQDYQLLQWSPDGHALLTGAGGRFEIFDADGHRKPRFVRGGEHGDWR